MSNKTSRKKFDNDEEDQDFIYYFEKKDKMRGIDKEIQKINILKKDYGSGYLKQTDS